MALTDAERGPRAAWLRRHRLALYGSGDNGLEMLAAALAQRGMARSAGTVKGWESSDERSPIPPDVLPHLEELFKDVAPRPVAPATMPELLNALRDQTAAMAEQTRVMGELVRELAAAREVSADVRERVAAVEAYAAEHELRFRADLARRGVDLSPDAPTRSLQSAGTR